jgi:hypothetical protein
VVVAAGAELPGTRKDSVNAPSLVFARLPVLCRFDACRHDPRERSAASGCIGRLRCCLVAAVRCVTVRFAPASRSRAICRRSMYSSISAMILSRDTGHNFIRRRRFCWQIKLNNDGPVSTDLGMTSDESRKRRGTTFAFLPARWAFYEDSTHLPACQKPIAL